MTTKIPSAEATPIGLLLAYGEALVGEREDARRRSAGAAHHAAGALEAARTLSLAAGRAEVAARMVGAVSEVVCEISPPTTEVAKHVVEGIQGVGERLHALAASGRESATHLEAIGSGADESASTVRAEERDLERLRLALRGRDRL